MQIGAQLYTVRAFTQKEQDFAETIKKIADIGYTQVQISAAGPIPAQVMADICRSNNIKIVITHTNPARIKNETEKVIEEHKIMGAGYIGLGSMPGEYHGGLDGIKRFIADYLPAAEKIREAGLMFMYHNHDAEFEKFEGKLFMEHLMEGFEPELMGFTLDTYWVQAGGGDPADWLLKLKSRVNVIHVKDMCMEKGKRRECEIFVGNLNWPRILEACKGAGVLHAMVEQDECYGEDPFVCLETSYKNLMEYFG